MSITERKRRDELRDFSRLEYAGMKVAVDFGVADEYMRRGKQAFDDRMYVLAMRNYAASLVIEFGSKTVRWPRIRELRQLMDQSFNGAVIGAMNPPALPAPVESAAYYRGKESASYGDDVTNPYALSPARGDWRRGFSDGKRAIKAAINSSQSEPYPYPDRFAKPEPSFHRPPSKAKRQYVKDRLKQIQSTT